MKQTWLVLRHEIATTLSKRSYWLMTFLFPLAILAYTGFTQWSTQELVSGSTSLLDDPEAAARPIGYVDPGGVVSFLPSDVPAGMLRAFPDATAAATALSGKEIDSYLLIPADYAQGGQLVVVDSEFSLFGSEGVTGLAGYILDANLLGSEELARAVLATENDTRMIGTYQRLQEATPGEEGGSGGQAPGIAGTIVPYAAMFIVFSVLSSGGGYVLQSVSSEKENRTVEMLLVSVEPRSLMLGKVLGLGAVSLMQMVIWVAAGGLIAGQGAGLFGAALDLDLPAGLGIYLVVYLALGYLSYASSLSAIGALAPSLREGAQFQMLVLAPLIAPLILNYPLMQEPNGPLAIVLSLFPLSAPLAMVLRLAMTAVPAWQIAVSIAGLAATSYMFVSLGARFFRADTLLSQKSLNWQRLFSEARRILRR